MIALVMAGGKGIRMNSYNEKLLLKYKKPIILHVIDSLKDSDCFSKILAVTSPNSPKTKKLLQENKVDIFDTPGIGYVEDLNMALQDIDDQVLVISGDLPLLDKEIIQKIVRQHDTQKIWTSVLTTKIFLTTLNVKSNYFVCFENQECCFTGISLVNSKKISSLDNLNENHVIIDDKRIALNLNTKQDYDLLGTT